MAFERAEGDETRTKALYIGLRVRRLKEQATIMAAAAEQAKQLSRSWEPPPAPPAEPYSPDPTQKPERAFEAAFVIIMIVMLIIILIGLFGFAATV